MPTPMILGETQRRELEDLRTRAANSPVDMAGLTERLRDPAQKQRHMAQMTDQTVEIPIGFLVTYSIETGHPIGTCRHVSVSASRPGRTPSPEAVQWVCHELGFTGDVLRDGTSTFWIEDLQRGRADQRAKAINVVQPLAATEGGTA